MSMDDLFNSVLGGAAGGDDDQAGDALGDILGGLLGGGQSSGGLDGILGGLLGGGAGGGQNAFLLPIADTISKKVGIPREIALMAVSFLLTKFLSGMGGKRSGSEGMELDEITRLAGADTRTQSAFFADSGLTQELAERTGMDEETAERTLEEAVRLVGGQLQEMQGTAPTDDADDAPPSNLLSNW